MADFKTHTIVAAGVSGAMTTGLLVHYQLSVPLALLFWASGTFGGILPDIDSDHSTSIRLIFQLLAGISAVITVVALHTRLPLWQLWLAGLISFLAVYYPLRQCFASFTIHRGILHSLLANLLFALVMIVAGYYLLDMHPWVAWGCGCFLFCGAIIHLLLDEIYSVDLAGGRLKSSFGSALKLTQWSEPLLSVVVIGLIGGLYYLAPPDHYWLHLMEHLFAPMIHFFKSL
ncbi:metal-dependent hydrolase [Celerinatantimonas diazotrophica]|uniref:LexA-binding, inner membrane-associated putative hydrolase n=1 Tax=Celerinatantimonas diazotrophica TaxID=412034 RepID=A0A4R1J9V1_9GAMM|nr:metal-dependent hydrolase [Celerinatantimonas diazotrophica]TCK47406.1 LexA-binding, inner membrane-associated putative hydrolase [Celerinatantimonas diazotrophica]CAG9294976.1 hypothetical protein CEDIAZO_00082 [Celerinatantimonas diazotrophica]